MSSPPTSLRAERSASSGGAAAREPSRHDAGQRSVHPRAPRRAGPLAPHERFVVDVAYLGDDVPLQPVPEGLEREHRAQRLGVRTVGVALLREHEHRARAVGRDPDKVLRARRRRSAPIHPKHQREVSAARVESARLTRRGDD